MTKEKFTFILVSLLLITGCPPFDGTGIQTSSSDTQFETSTSTSTSTEIGTTEIQVITSSGSPFDTTTSDIGETIDTNIPTSDGISSSSISSSGELISECGNLIIEPGEECDNYTANCNKDCTFSVCGDGKWNDPYEKCDDGNDDDLDDCNNLCYPARWVFLSSDYIGPADFGGLLIADQFCQNDAQKFGLEGQYKAWLSDDSALNSPMFRFDSFEYKGFYKLRTPFPTILAYGWDGLMDLQYPINIQANGLQDLGVITVWTSTLANGARSDGSTCNNWTVMQLGSDFEAKVGDPQKSDNGWTYGYTKSCGSRVGAKLYCFQVNN